MKKIRTLIIEDSALTRSVLERIIGADDNIEVVGTAIDPIIAAKKINALNPDVITLDIVMPRMDGLTFLKKLMKSRPTPVIIISGNSPKDSINAIKALESGAMEIIEKPDISTPERLKEVSENITMAIKAAYASLEVKEPVKVELEEPQVEIIRKRRPRSTRVNGSPGLYVIGASTGGPDTLKRILYKINPDCQGIVIAQHMPPVFTASFAQRLNDECELYVVEAKDGERIEQGKVIVIPGDYHGQIKRDVQGYYIALNKSEKVNRHRPSVDVLFDSAAQVVGPSATGILLTGMGEDGAYGLLRMKKNGSTTITQRAESCVVYGMPRKAVEIGASDNRLIPEEISIWINENIN